MAKQLVYTVKTFPKLHEREQTENALPTDFKDAIKCLPTPKCCLMFVKGDISKHCWMYGWARRQTKQENIEWTSNNTGEKPTPAEATQWDDQHPSLLEHFPINHIIH